MCSPRLHFFTVPSYFLLPKIPSEVRKSEKVISKNPAHKMRTGFLVPVTGLEPVRCCHRGILSPLRLPIPPHRHNANIIPSVSRNVKCFYEIGKNSDESGRLRRTFCPALKPFLLSETADFIFAKVSFAVRRRCMTGILLENTVKVAQTCIAEHIGKLKQRNL